MPVIDMTSRICKRHAISEENPNGFPASIPEPSNANDPEAAALIRVFHSLNLTGSGAKIFTQTSGLVSCSVISHATNVCLEATRKERVGVGFEHSFGPVSAMAVGLINAAFAYLDVLPPGIKARVLDVLIEKTNKAIENQRGIENENQ